MTVLRRTEANRGAPAWQILRCAGVAAMTVLVSVSAARAGDDDDVNPRTNESFEHRLIGDLLRGLGAQSPEDMNSGIKYRERSPLVVPSNLNLPPPSKESTPKIANWPKDPDVAARRAAIEESQRAAPDWDQAKLPLMPSELAGKSSKKKKSTTTEVIPGPDNSNVYKLMPSELGFTNGMWSKMFGKEKADTKAFVAEPPRESLTEPPPGYQTPSTAFAYGSGPIKGTTNDAYNPITDKGDRTIGQ